MIHALPGMGGDHRMFLRDWLTLPDFVAHDWMAYKDESTLADVARAFCNAKNVCDGDVLVGTSLGGMVACEITKIRKIPKLFLVGSAASHKEVSHLLAMLKPLLPVIPLRLTKRLAAQSSSPVFQMFAGTDIAFLRAMSRAIFEWEGFAAPPTRIHRVHGRRDWVIPPPRTADLLLDGGHLIAMTHAKECSEYVLRHAFSYEDST